MFRRRAALIPLLLGLGAFGPEVRGGVPTTTHNPRVVPTVVGVTVGHPLFDGEPNTMMFSLTVQVDDTLNNALHDAVVGYVPTADYLACNRTTPWKYSSDVLRFDYESTRTFSLYNFVPDTAYTYVVRTGYGGNYKYSCGALPTPTLPTAVGALNFQYETAGPTHPVETRYVLLNMDDCGASGASSTGSHAQFMVLDTEAQTAVWYLDVAQMTGLDDPTVTGWRYQRATMDTPARLLVLIDKRYLYDWTFDGGLRGYHDFGATCADDQTGPCAHHDVIQSEETGNTYAIVSKESKQDPTDTLWEECGTESKFLDDGFQVLDDAYGKLTEFYLMSDYGYDPTVESGPYDRAVTSSSDVCAASIWMDYLSGEVIDWTHMNSLDLSVVGGVEVLDISLHGWDQVIRVNADDGSYITSIAGDSDYSDLGSLRMAKGIDGDATFSAQHDVHSVGYDTLMMLDNLGDRTGGSRVLRISNISTDPTIDRNWPLIDATGKPMECPVEGSAQEVPGASGNNVLSVCQDAYAVIELSEFHGDVSSTGHPPLFISLPDGETDPYCSVGGPSSRRYLRGLYRAYPLAALGSFD